jgi:hypothetical protein
MPNKFLPSSATISLWEVCFSSTFWKAHTKVIHLLNLFFVLTHFCAFWCSTRIFPSYVFLSFVNEILIWKKNGVLQLALQLNFWIAKDTCNSMYLYIVSVNGKIAWIAELQLTIYIASQCNSIVI